MKDLITLILVPNPLSRPNIDQILQILDNWNQLQTIKLTQDATEIKYRLTQKSTQNPVATSSVGKDLTADDIFKL